MRLLVGLSCASALTSWFTVVNDHVASDNVENSRGARRHDRTEIRSDDDYPVVLPLGVKVL
jgi:hypothetical protein